jgi:KUP system potassium uptake protein
VLLAALVYGAMYIWHRGAAAVTERLHESLIPIDAFLKKLEDDKIARVPGTAVFLTRAQRETPPVMAWHVTHNRALHQHVIAITSTIEPIPWVADNERVTATQIAPGFWRAAARYGFMERPNVPHLLEQLRGRGCAIELNDVTYYVGHETITHRTDGKGIPRWQEALFATMVRNANRITDFFALPSDQVVEIGRQISI